VYLGQRLSNIATDFDPRTYGYRKLSALVRKTGAFEIDQPEIGGLRVRLKPKEAQLPKERPTRRRGPSAKKVES
jgi:hypothetical protein